MKVHLSAKNRNNFQATIKKVAKKHVKKCPRCVSAQRHIHVSITSSKISHTHGKKNVLQCVLLWAGSSPSQGDKTTSSRRFFRELLRDMRTNKEEANTVTCGNNVPLNIQIGVGRTSLSACRSAIQWWMSTYKDECMASRYREEKC